jgi:ABC-type lipoprotein release transport system permease subunit
MSPFDPVAITGAVVLCVMVTLFACYVPVRRAMRIAASDALKTE